MAAIVFFKQKTANWMRISDWISDVCSSDLKVLKVTFPDEYPVENLKGKPAEFAVTVKEVKVPAASKIDDDFAKTLGLESLDKLKELMKDQVEQELNGLTRTYMKRKQIGRAAGRERVIKTV